MRTSESNLQLMRLFRRLRSYFAVVAVPRETERSPRVSLSRNNGGSFRRLFEAAQSTDRTQRYRKPLRARYARMIALVVELLILIDGCFNSPQSIQFLFPAFRCLSRGLFSLRRSGPRNGQNSRRRDSTVLERPARSPCGAQPRRLWSTQRYVLRAILRKLPFGSTACAVERGSIDWPLCISAYVDLGPRSPRLAVIGQSIDATRPAWRSLRALLAP